MRFRGSNRYHAGTKYAFAILVITLATVCDSQAQDITGDWQGTLTNDMGELRLIVHVTKAADGTLKATMDSPDQAMAGAPLDTFTLDGTKVHFTLNVAKGVFDGSLKGSSSISGSWTQGPSPKMPLTLNKTTTPLKLQHDPAPPSDIDGAWEGIYDTPAGESGRVGKNHVTFHIKNTADGLTATLDLPDANIKGWPATSVTRKGSSIKIATKQINTIFSGKANKNLDAISGDWTQGDGPSRALILKRTKEDSPDAQKPKQ
jgi:hypothetical protein